MNNTDIKKQTIENIRYVALYERLSRDYELAGPSNSIINQKVILEDYAKKNGFANYRHFTEACDIIEPTQETA